MPRDNETRSLGRRATEEDRDTFSLRLCVAVLLLNKPSQKLRIGHPNTANLPQ
jgi:hypothetical protein